MKLCCSLKIWHSYLSKNTYICIVPNDKTCELSFVHNTFILPEKIQKTANFSSGNFHFWPIVGKNKNYYIGGDNESSGAPEH